MSDTDYILETNALDRQFETAKPLFGKAKVIRAVDGVDLKIRRGETFAVVGESGCGKSTLARLLVRLIRPTVGNVKYEGRNIAEISDQDLRALRRDLQFVFQDPFPSLNQRMTVGALIEKPMQVHDIGTLAERRSKVEGLLARVGLSPEIVDRYPHEFSGGQRQRIGIARALASGPKVLIGDEPVSALDVSIQAQVVNILEALKREFGLTLIVIAHDLAVVRRKSDRVAVMHLGEIIELATVDALCTAPQHPYTAALIAAIPIAQVGARGATAKLEGDPPNPIDLPGGCRFHPRCAHATELCQTDRPALKARDGGGRVACHHADTLNLVGLDTEQAGRSPAATARFDLCRAARARSAGGPIANPSET